MSSEKKLTSEDAIGAVKYRVENLPEGIALEGDTLKVKDMTKLTNGYYPIRINVQDSQGNEDDQLILLMIKKRPISQGSVSVSSFLTQSLNYDAT